MEACRSKASNRYIFFMHSISNSSLGCLEVQGPKSKHFSRILNQIRHLEAWRSKAPRSIHFLSEFLSKFVTWRFGGPRVQIDTFFFGIPNQIRHLDPWRSKVWNRNIFLISFNQIRDLKGWRSKAPNRHIFFQNSWSNSSLGGLEPKASQSIRFVFEFFIKFVTWRLAGPRPQSIHFLYEFEIKFVTWRLGRPKFQIDTFSLWILYEIRHLDAWTSKAPNRYIFFKNS